MYLVEDCALWGAFNGRLWVVEYVQAEIVGRATWPDNGVLTFNVKRLSL